MLLFFYIAVGYRCVARYYESAIGRFTTIDPLAEKYYSWSPYVYVANNPLKYIDPDGREKLNGMGTRDKGYQLVNARKNVDNGMSIYGHGLLDGMTYVHSDGRTTSIRNALQLQEFLKKIAKHGNQEEKVRICMSFCTLARQDHRKIYYLWLSLYQVKCQMS